MYVYILPISTNLLFDFGVDVGFEVLYIILCFSKKLCH